MQQWWIASILDVLQDLLVSMKGKPAGSYNKLTITVQMTITYEGFASFKTHFTHQQNSLSCTFFGHL